MLYRVSYSMFFSHIVTKKVKDKKKKVYQSSYTYINCFSSLCFWEFFTSFSFYLWMFEVMLLSLFNLFSRGFLHSCHDFVLQKRKIPQREREFIIIHYIFLYICDQCTQQRQTHTRKINVQARLSLSLFPTIYLFTNYCNNFPFVSCIVTYTASFFFLEKRKSSLIFILFHY